MSSVLAFLNSGLGLVLVGAVVGAIGLFTWQRQDWIFKQAYLRSEVLLDRRLTLIEAINKDVGALLADANSMIASVQKGMGPGQRDGTVTLYNEEQARWFGAAPAHAALVAFYFPAEVAHGFKGDLVARTGELDVALYRLSTQAITPADAWQVSRSVQDGLEVWNARAMAALNAKPQAH